MLYDELVAQATANLRASETYATRAAVDSAAANDERSMLAWEVRRNLLGVALDALDRIPGLGLLMAPPELIGPDPANGSRRVTEAELVAARELAGEAG